MTKQTYNNAVANSDNAVETVVMNAGFEKKALGGIFKSTHDASKGVQALKELIENAKINTEKENIHANGTKIPNVFVELKKYKDYTLVSVASDGDTSSMNPVAIIDYGVYHFKTASSNYGTGFKSADGFLTDGIGHAYIYILRDGEYEIVETTNWPRCTRKTVKITEKTPWPFGEHTSICLFEVPAEKEEEILEGVDEEHVAWAFFPDLYCKRMRLIFNGKDLSSDRYMRKFLKGVKVTTDSRPICDDLTIESFRFDTVKPAIANSIFERNQANQGVYQFANGRNVENSRFCTIIERKINGTNVWFKKGFTHPALNGVKWAFNVYSTNGEFMEYPYSGNDKSAVNWRSKARGNLATRIRTLEDSIAGAHVRSIYSSCAMDYIAKILSNGFMFAAMASGNAIFVPKSDIPKEIVNGYENNRLPDGLICGKTPTGHPDYTNIQVFIKYKKGVVRDEDIDQPIRFGEYLDLPSRRVLIIGTELHKYAKIHMDDIHNKAKTRLKNAKSAIDHVNLLVNSNPENEVFRSLLENAEAQLEYTRKHDDVHVTFVSWDRIGLDPKNVEKGDVNYNEIIDIYNAVHAA